METETKIDIIELSRGYIGIILMAILMFTGIVSGMFAGESMTFETNLTNPVYIVTGNSSDLTGLNVSFENGNITISTIINYKPDNFTLIFFENQTNTEYIEVEKIIYTGGGSSTKYKDKIVIQNETIYVPEYIDVEKIVEVDKIIDNTKVIKTGYELWHIILGMLLGVGFGLYIIKPKKKEEEEVIN